MEATKMHNIFSLSDYSLIHIFKYLNCTDLYHLSLTCKRFEGLVKDKKFWYIIDARDKPNTKEKVKFCVERINKKTTDFLVCADQRDIQVLPDDFFSIDACSKLTVLALENQIIRGDLAKLSQYPKTLVELSLRKSYINNHSTFFKLSYLQMENLKVLILDECGFVETYMIVQMSKYPKLEILSMYKCKKLSDNDIAYLSLAGCFGFKKLRILDIRFTGLGDQILKTFYKHPTLQELYFQSYLSTYGRDITRRRHEIAHGDSDIKSHAYLSKYDEIPDNDLESMQQFFGAHHRYRTCRHQNLSNHGTVMYKFVIPNEDNDYEAKSVLYKSPYGECTCGSRKTKVTIAKKQTAHDAFTFVLTPTPQTNKNKSDAALYEEASETNKEMDWLTVREPLNLFEIAMYEHTDILTAQHHLVLPSDEPTNSSTRNYRINRSNESNDSRNENKNLNVSGRVLSVAHGDVIVEEVYEVSRSQGVLLEKTTKRILGQGQNDKENKDNKKPNDNPSKKDDDEKASSSNVHNYLDNGGNSSRKLIHVKFIEDRSSNNDTQDESKSTDSTENSKDEAKKCKICNRSLSDNANINDKCTCKEHRTTLADYFRSKINYSGLTKRLRRRPCAAEDCVCLPHLVPLKTLDQKVENNKCKVCGSNISNKSDDMCLKCKESKNNGSITSELDNPTPSTSKDTNSSPNASTKRKRDNSTNTPNIKKPKLSPDDSEAGPSGLQADINISYEVDNAPANAFYIRIKMPEPDEIEPDLINVPMGGGLINILLGVDNKTKVAIKKLSLRGFPKITNCTLDYLTPLKLELLDITDTGISKTAVQNFIRENPTCRVIHESACTCLPNLYF